jgi:hypothetical protein
MESECRGSGGMADAPDLGSGAARCRSSSLLSRTKLILGYSQVGKARDFDSRMRWFESSYPSHMVAVVKWLTRRIVAPVLEGSRPSSHPI